MVQRFLILKLAPFKLKHIKINQVFIIFVIIQKPLPHFFFIEIKAKLNLLIIKGIYNGGSVSLIYEKGIFNIDTIYNALIVKSVSLLLIYLLQALASFLCTEV